AACSTARRRTASAGWSPSAKPKTPPRRRSARMSQPNTLYQKVWDRHVVVPETAETPGVMYVDLHLVHEVTSPQAFSEIEARGLKVRRPDRTFATLDHSTPTLPAGPDGTL